MILQLSQVNNVDYANQTIENGHYLTVTVAVQSQTNGTEFMQQENILLDTPVMKC